MKVWWKIGKPNHHLKRFGHIENVAAIEMTLAAGTRMPNHFPVRNQNCLKMVLWRYHPMAMVMPSKWMAAFHCVGGCQGGQWRQNGMDQKKRSFWWQNCRDFSSHGSPLACRSCSRPPSGVPTVQTTGLALPWARSPSLGESNFKVDWSTKGQGND